jgi:hypothetical protein
MIDEEVNEFLEHYGVLGMHWGVRNEEKRQAIRDTKAKKFETKAKDIQRKIDNTSKYRPIHKQKLREKRALALSDAEKKRQGKLSHRQKQVAVGSSVVAALLATYVAYSTLNSGEGRRLASKGKDFVTHRNFEFNRNAQLADPNLDVDGIMSKVVSHVNPQYGAPGTKNNCRRATYAYEMRRRGYDVSATKTATGRGQDASGIFNVLHPRTKTVPSGKSGQITRIVTEAHAKAKRGSETPFTDMVTNPGSIFGEHNFKADTHGGIASAIRSHIATQPDGARGELGVSWRGGGGHSLSWEKIKGQFVVFDNQTGKKYVGTDFDQLSTKFAQAGITRLDNKELNQDFLRRWLKSA